MSAWPRIVLHCGAHKTASSLVQTLLRRDAAALAARGVGVVHRASVLASPLGAALGAIFDGGAEVDAAASAAALAALIPPGCHTVILSNEDMLHRLADPPGHMRAADALRHLVAAATGHRVEVVLYVRSQPDWLESVFLQFMALGRGFGFEGFLARFGGRGPGWGPDWCRLVDRLADVLGDADALHVLPYEAIHTAGPTAFYQQFLSACGVEAGGLPPVETAQAGGHAANRSYSAEALRLARAVAPLLGGDKGAGVRLRRHLQIHYSTATHARAMLFTPDQRRAVLGWHGDANADLFARWMPRFAPLAEVYR